MNWDLTILSDPSLLPQLAKTAREGGGFRKISTVSTLEELMTFDAADWSSTLLVSFCTGVIVPASILDALQGRAINIHPASKDFPGRDPHHFACYNGTEEFGATAHLMTPRVDAGTILREKLCPVGPDVTPGELRQLGEKCGQDLYQYVVTEWPKTGNLEPAANLEWAGRKSTRRDFVELCRIHPLMDEREVEKRIRATRSEGYTNLRMDVGGRTFALSEVDEHAGQASEAWVDFTEDAYRGMIRAALSRGYEFSSYRDRSEGPHVLWRHDIDYSLHRSLRLSQIETEEGVKATYFVGLRLPFYNTLEKESVNILKEIVSGGHDIGLHFDAGFYDIEWTAADLNARVSVEKQIVEDNVGVELKAVSFHDPTAGNMMAFDAPEIGGLVNAYGAPLKESYEYCSDSNGHWRHKRILDVIESGEGRNLQILTHPGWWLPEAMPPRQRIERAVMGRARAVMAQYDAHLEKSGRQNIAD